MKTSTGFVLATGLLLTGVSARSIPDNVKAFYNKVKSAGACPSASTYKGGFYSQEGDSHKYSYCHRYFDNGLYIKGPGFELTNMDVDCDGNQNGLDSRCGSSQDTQSETAFKDQVKKFGIPDLRSDIHPYVVLGNYGDYSPTFDPEDVGIKPLSLVAIVCNNKLIYGFWGDTNGDDGPPLVGEASLAVGTACYGNSINGDNGHDDTDVLYIAFKGDSAALNGGNANWKAKSYADFESSITALGDKLVAQL